MTTLTYLVALLALLPVILTKPTKYPMIAPFYGGCKNMIPRNTGLVVKPAEHGKHVGHGRHAEQGKDYTEGMYVARLTFFSLQTQIIKTSVLIGECVFFFVF
jgi:hypothetical protein